MSKKHQKKVDKNKTFRNKDDDLQKDCKNTSLISKAVLPQAKYTAGCVVWVKWIKTWWPGMIENEPDTKKFYWKDEDTNEMVYNVTFFDLKVSRFVVNATGVKEFTDASQYYKAGKMSERLIKAVEMAEHACSLSKSTRLKKYSFVGRYKGRTQINREKVPKSSPPDVPSVKVSNMNGTSSSQKRNQNASPPLETKIKKKRGVQKEKASTEVKPNVKEIHNGKNTAAVSVKKDIPTEEVIITPPPKHTIPPIQEVTIPPPQKVTNPPNEEVTNSPTQEVTIHPHQKVIIPPTQEVTIPPTQDITNHSTQEVKEVNEASSLKKVVNSTESYVIRDVNMSVDGIELDVASASSEEENSQDMDCEENWDVRKLLWSPSPSYDHNEDETSLSNDESIPDMETKDPEIYQSSSCITQSEKTLAGKKPYEVDHFGPVYFDLFNTSEARRNHEILKNYTFIQIPDLDENDPLNQG